MYSVLNDADITCLKAIVEEPSDKYLEEKEFLCEILKTVDLDRLHEIAKLPVLTQEELDKVIDKHSKWLLGKKGGECADLSYKDLSYLDMSNCDLSCANFKGARLNHTDMTSSNFLCCDFRNAEMVAPCIQNTCFYEADMRYAKMTGFYPQDVAFYGAHHDGNQMANGVSMFMTDAQIDDMKLRIRDAMEDINKARASDHKNHGR